MLSVDYSKLHRVLRVTVSGVLTAELIHELDEAIITFIQREGAVHRLIDLSQVTRVDLSPDFVVRRGRQLPVRMGVKRVIVVPADPAAHGLAELFRAQQDQPDTDVPKLVRTLEEAYVELGIDAGAFHVPGLLRP